MEKPSSVPFPGCEVYRLVVWEFVSLVPICPPLPAKITTCVIIKNKPGEGGTVMCRVVSLVCVASLPYRQRAHLSLFFSMIAMSIMVGLHGGGFGGSADNTLPTTTGSHPFDA